MKQKLMFLAASVIFACILMYPMVSGAVHGQSYSGDGAVNNPTIPPGGWNIDQALYPSCLTCHFPGNTVGAPDKTSYLMTGHKNVLRIFPLPYYYPPYLPFALTNPTGQPYNADLFGDLFNWNDYTITLQGYCTVSLYTDPTSCSNGGGVWLSGTKNLYYIYGGWMSAAPLALYDGSYFQNGQKTAVSYSCGRCHTTGFTMDAAIDTRCSITGKPPALVCRTPENDFPGITWTPSNPSGLINLDPDGNGPAVSSSWAIGSSGDSLEGVQCERCHDATKHNPATMTPKGAAATALCLQCHRQDHVVTYTTGSMGANIHPTPFTDNASLPVSEPVYTLPAIEVGRSDGTYAPVFYPYSTGMEYLNSTHGKFTGTFQQISDPSKYLSSFITSSVDGGCTKCHDVHQSTVAAVNAAAPFKKACPDCHQEGTTRGLAQIYHPSGPGTPLGDLSNIPAACAKCHMPKPNNGEGSSSHIWRISTSASYTTFPSQTEWDAGQKTALAATAGTYTNAVWMDLNLVCGQCHGNTDLAQRIAHHYFNKPALATKAVGMHTGSPWTTVCTGCHTGGVDPAAPQINPGIDHHTGGCTACHTNPGFPQFTLTNASCLSCHSTTPPGTSLQPVVQGTNHHTGNCITCHTKPGVPQFDSTNASCLSCHSTTPPGTNLQPVVQGTNHHTGNCITCHTNPGVPQFDSTNASCLSCHSTTPPGTNLQPVVQGQNHHTGNCVSCHTAPGTPQLTTTNASCLSCHSTTPPGTNLQPVVQGTNHHTGNCITCHTNPGVPQFDSTKASCLSCHSTTPPGTNLQPVVQGTNHHTGNCVSCHTEPGTPQLTTTNASCLSCHSTTPPGTNLQPIVQGTNHHTGNCITCHTNPGVPQFDSTNASCLSCHSTTPPGTNLQPVVQGTNHHSGTCVSCHTAPGTPQLNLTTDSCKSCHTSENLTTMNHPMGPTTGGGAPGTCVACHFEPGVAVLTLGIQAVCGQCHGGSSNVTQNGAPYFDLPTLTAAAVNMHNTIPTARFNWRTDATADYKVLYDASASTCPVGATCTYAWSTGETGITAFHTFANSATTTVTLTVTSSSGQSNSTSQAVTPKYVAEHPTSLGAGLTVTPNGFSPAVNWSVSGGVAPYTVTTNWGDGTNSSVTQPLAGPGSLGHTYLNSGTYTVTVSAVDSGANGSNVTTASATATLTIAPVSVSGLVISSTGTPLSGVSLSLQLSGATKKITSTAADGTYAFPDVSPGTYTITASKSGYTFATPAASGIVVTGMANVTGVNISATAPVVISVSGTVYKKDGTTPLSNVGLSLKLNGVVKYLATSLADGTYTFKPVAPGNYTISASRTGYTFAEPAASVIVGSSSVTGVNINATGP